MTSHFTDTVMYIEDSDINGDAIANMPGIGVILIQKSGCPPCVAAKPEYQKFADEMAGSNVGVYTVQIDTDKLAASAIARMVPGFRGTPTYVMFRDGRYVATHSGPRTAEALKAFVKSGGENRTELNLPPRSRRVRFD